jgi:predicted TIM-barrel fold metal-dependent hydrolase
VAGRIDLHYHVIPPQYVAELGQRGVHGSALARFPAWSVESALADLDHNEVATAVTSLSSPGVQFGDPALGRRLARLSNELQSRMIADHPKRFGAFAFLPLPDVEGALTELEYALDVLGLDGVVLLSDVGGACLGDPGQDELFAELDRRHVVAFVHPHTEPNRTRRDEVFHPLLEWPVHATRAVLNLLHRGHLERFPDIRYILAHGGGTVPYLVHRVVTGAPGEHRPEASGQLNLLRSLYYDTGLLGEAHLAALRRFVGASQIVFGTDGGWATRHHTAAALRALLTYDGFDRARLTAIERGNALALFPRLTP